MESFDALPLAAVVSDQFFCIHGGISENIKSVDDLRGVNRFAEPPQKGAACDVLWADPMEDFDTYNGEQRFFFNDIRSCSCVFSYKAACDFLDRNHLRCIIRAHEAQDEGFVPLEISIDMSFNYRSFNQLFVDTRLIDKKTISQLLSHYFLLQITWTHMETRVQSWSLTEV